jgi:sterol desaturase/sphingolipid hydroxylase (fatty acid hydroxylase superfamily)
MWETIQAYEPAIRLSAFLGIFVVMALWEAMVPRRKRLFSRLARWPHNIGVVILNTVILRLLFPTAAIGVALAAESNGWGLFNNLALPSLLVLVLSVVIMDFAIYLQHVLVHAVPALWRLHRMHHTDLDYDVTTGARFHPLEIVISMGLKLMVVGALGAPALAVLIFEVILNATAMFNHANVRLPAGLDQWLRLIVVTPDMHRVHHSVIPKETNSNFGFNLPWWDRLFGTYIPQPRAGHEGMTIGIEQFCESRDQRLDRMLIQPFLGGAGNYAINRERDSSRGD